MSLASQAETSGHWSYEQYEQAVRNSPLRRITLVLEAQSKILGFLVAQAIDHEWELENIVVAASHRRTGFGSRLLNEFLDLIRREQAESIFLEVRESNHAARRLYEKFGFVQTARRPNYYNQPREDALTCQLKIS